VTTRAINFHCPRERRAPRHAADGAASRSAMLLLYISDKVGYIVYLRSTHGLAYRRNHTALLWRSKRDVVERPSRLDA